MIRQPRSILAALTAVCIAAVALAAVQDPADRFAGVELSVVPAAGQVHMVQRPGGGGNVGVFAGPDGVLLVDSLFAPLADRLVAAVRSVTGGRIRFLINTHVHPDHIGGNEPLAGRDVLIFAHDNVRVRALERLRFPRRGGQFRAASGGGCTAGRYLQRRGELSLQRRGRAGVSRAGRPHRRRHLRPLSGV